MITIRTNAQCGFVRRHSSPVFALYYYRRLLYSTIGTLSLHNILIHSTEVYGVSSNLRVQYELWGSVSTLDGGKRVRVWIEQQRQQNHGAYFQTDILPLVQFSLTPRRKRISTRVLRFLSLVNVKRYGSCMCEYQERVFCQQFLISYYVRICAYLILFALHRVRCQRNRD